MIDRGTDNTQGREEDLHTGEAPTLMGRGLTPTRIVDPKCQGRYAARNSFQLVCRERSSVS
jgi:hypothetical protein